MRFAVSIALLFAAAPAHADWQYTRWGMTVNEVLAAGNGRVIRHDSPAMSDTVSQMRAVAKHSADGMSFTAFFGFGAESNLNQVMLVLNEGSRCLLLRDSLRSVYGEGRLFDIRPGLVPGVKWRDEASGNMIDFLTISRTCTVTYEPIRTTKETGL